MPLESMKQKKSIKIQEIIVHTNPAGYAKTPVVGETSNAALLQTVSPSTFFNLICDKNDKTNNTKINKKAKNKVKQMEFKCFNYY